MTGKTPLIDFHSHILPRVDHGSSGMTETTKQLQLIASANVDVVVATPHFYPNADSVAAFLARVDAAVERIRSTEVPVNKLCLGAEVLYCPQLERMDGLERLCVRGTNVLLLEAPMDPWNDAFLHTVEALLQRFTVVLAHIDRYARTQTEELHQLLEMGALAQINGYALSSLLLRKKLKPFLETDGVVALGSDLHGADPKSYTRFLAARKHLGEQYDRIMLRSAELLANANGITQCV